MKEVFVLLSSVGGARFIHGVVSSEDAAKEWVEDSSGAFASSGADYFYREFELDNPR